MSTATALSRITGFVRMWATGFALGVTSLAASYNVANNIPNMIFELVAGGILSSLFIPTYLELKAERGEADAGRFASHVFNLAVLSLGVVAVLGTLFPEPFIWTQTFRMDAASGAQVRADAELLFRFFAIQVVIYGGGMVMQGLLNAHRKYLWPALGPVFNNVVVIATMFIYAAMVPSDPDRALIVLAIGTTLGVFTMFAVMVPDLVRSKVRYHAELGLADPAVRRMLVLAVPTVIYVVTNLVAVSFRNASAFAVAENGPSVLMYAWTFYQLPYGILAVALATAVFTELSDAAGRKDFDALKRHFTSGLSTTGVLMLPASAALIALAEPLVSLYQVGAFEASAVPEVASALRWWALGLTFFAAMMFTLRTFYSLKDTRTPMLVNLALAVLHIGLYWVLSTGIGAWPGIGINGIPIADAVFYAAMLLVLTVLLRRRLGGFDVANVASTYLRMAFASTVAGVVAWWLSTAMAPMTPGISGALVRIAVAGTVCLVIAFGLGRLLGVTEVSSAVALGRRAVAKLGGRRRS